MIPAERLHPYEDYLHVDGELRIGGHDVDDYLYGRCHLFALAASRALGLKLRIIIDPAPLDDDLYPLPNPVLCHAGCVIPDESELVLDARGVLDQSEWIREYCPGEYEVLEHDDALAWLETFLPAEFDPGEEQALTTYALAMQACGLLTPIEKEEEE